MADEDIHDNDNDYEEKVILSMKYLWVNNLLTCNSLPLGQECQHYCSTPCKQEVNKENPQACPQGIPS